MSGENLETVRRHIEVWNLRDLTTSRTGRLLGSGSSKTEPKLSKPPDCGSRA
jgi:hypothetical protein